MRGPATFLSAMILACAPELPVQEVTVFAPGSISAQDRGLYGGSFTSDGTSFYFFRKISEQEDYRIYVSTLEPEGWGAPARVPLGGGEHSDLYPTISPDGERLVFSSYRPFPGDTAAEPNANLWLAERQEGGWSVPVPLTALSTPENYDAEPWFDTAGNLHWVSTAPDWRTRWHRRASAPGLLLWEADDLLAPWADWRQDVHLWGGVPSPDGQLMVLVLSERSDQGDWGQSNLWLSRRSRGQWSDPVRLGESVNTTDSDENFVVFSPDGRRMIFVRGFKTYFQVDVSDLPVE